MQSLEIVVIYILIIWNILVFSIYGIDKYKAQKGKWRISESTLIISAFLMGGLGAIFGMRIFHHKTKHLKFKILVPMALIINTAVILGAVYLLYFRR
ncbi:MAG: DUF1294 domain-containing protein [Oscillospiraceae bacterium]